MSPADQAFWQLAQRRVAGLQPAVAAAVLRAFALLRAQLSEVQLARLIASGDPDAVLRQLLTDPVLQSAFFPVREQIRTAIGRGVAYAARAVPSLPAPPSSGISGTVGISFDVLNPKVIDAIRALETRVITSLESDVRETIRAIIENGLRDGSAPATIARDIRGMIGLGPTQLQEVENFRDALQGLNGRTIADYTLRDKRFDRTVAKALGADGKGLTSAQIDKMVQTYARRRIAQNAETISRTATAEAQKSGQRMAYQDAVDKGIVDGSRLRHMWIGVDDGRERPSHVAMNNESQPWDQPYSSGQMYPGEGEYNCRCVDRFYLAASE